MTNPTIRVLLEGDFGRLDDDETDYDLQDFGGVLPSPGDHILNRWVDQGRDRNTQTDREILEVVRRVFNPKDLGGSYIALVVKARPLGAEELALMP